MRRTQLYLDDDLWQALHARARGEGTTISELVRQAARERYLGKIQERDAAMEALVGLRKARPEFSNPTKYIRNLRRSTRMKRLEKS
jgi:hypothetical protein